MASPQILSVGQCGFDHNRIAVQFQRSFGARVHGVSTAAEAMEALRAGHYDLVLINRVNDSDGTLGVDMIRSLKAVADLAHLPLMLVSNLAEAQQEATALGALPGFGKSDLAAPQTLTRLEALVGAGSTQGRR